MSDDKILLMCASIDRVAHVPSITHRADCGHEVWVSLTMAGHITKPNVTVKCTNCVKPSDVKGATTAITPAQRTEMNNLLGVAKTDQAVAFLNAKELDIS